MPRAGLSPQRVVETSADLADEMGLDRLTLAAVAQRLGVRQPSLYNHVDGLPALLHSLTLESKHELADVLAWATMGKSGPAAFHALAAAYRDWALRHPGRYAATVPAPAPTDADDIAASGRVMQVFLSVLAGFGIEAEEERVHAHRAVRASLHGFVSHEASGAFGIPVPASESYEYLVNILIEWLMQRSPAAAVEDER
jgi:AcrR family transcriptional regulator